MVPVNVNIYIYIIYMLPKFYLIGTKTLSHQKFLISNGITQNYGLRGSIG